jgi:hypothetical protein
MCATTNVVDGGAVMQRIFGSLLVVLIAASCGAEGASSPTDANTNGDASSSDAGGCNVSVTFNPDPAEAAPQMEARAIALVSGAAGVISYRWQITAGGRVVSTINAQPDGSQVRFPIDQAGVYQAVVIVDSSTFCPSGSGYLNVAAMGANSVPYRLRFNAPNGNGTAIQDRVVVVRGGADYFTGPLTLERGAQATASLLSGPSPVSAYVRISSTGTSAPIVQDAFAGSAGTVAAQLQFANYDVMIVPGNPALAPKQLVWDSLPTTFDIDAGTAVSGIVRGPTAAPLANARVAIRINGVPSTIATTASDGTFTVRARPVPGATVEVRVVADNGLPSLIASGVFDLTTPLQVRYDSSLSTRNLQGLQIRDSANQLLAMTTVAFHGELTSAGSVVAGVSVSARGAVEGSVMSNATAQLASVMVPAIPLTLAAGSGSNSGVVSLPAATPATLKLDASAHFTATVTLAGAPVAGVEFTLTPTTSSPLAILPSVNLTARSLANGSVDILAAAATVYSLRIVDPQRRIASITRTNVTASNIGSVAATKALSIVGTAVRPGSSSPLANFGVELFCVQCSIAEQAVPLDHGVTDGSGFFRVSAPDPGTR